MMAPGPEQVAKMTRDVTCTALCSGWSWPRVQTWREVPGVMRGCMYGTTAAHMAYVCVCCGL